MSPDKKKLINSLYFPGTILLVIWLVKIVEVVFDIKLSFLGVYPLKAHGLIGILTSPLIHGDWEHLMANSVPLVFLGASLFYFYRQIAYRVFILLYIITGIWVWFLARDAYHIGASGVIYGLASFLFFSGLIRKNPPLMAITMAITFLYGSMVWGMFPDFIKEKNISWESHLMGAVAGLILAIFYRNEGPQPKEYKWEDEDEDEDDENAYWKVPAKNN